MTSTNCENEVLTKQDIDHPDPPQVRRNAYGIYVYEPQEQNNSKTPTSSPQLDITTRM